MQSASRVGALVVLFVCLVLGVFAVLNRGIFGAANRTYWARFDDAGGVAKGTEITISGVDVGQVAEVKLDNGKALIKLSIHKDIQLTSDAKAAVPGSFIGVGDKIMTLTPPSPGGQPLQEDNRNSPIPGRLQGPLDAMLPDSGETIKDLNKTLVALQNVLADGKLKENLNAVMTSTATTADKFGGTAQRVNGLIDTDGPKLTVIMDSVKHSLANLEVVSSEVKKVVADGQLKGNVDKLMKDLDAAVASGKVMVDDLHKYTGDTKLHDSIAASIQNVNDMTTSGTKIAKNFEEISANGVTISKTAVGTGQKVDQLMDKANHLADQVGGVLDDAKGAIKKIGGKEHGSLIPPISMEADLMHQAGPDRLRVDIDFGVPIGKDRFLFGFYDAFETNKLDAQWQQNINPGLDLRYGVYASQPGVGVDLAPGSKLGLRADLFGLNNTEFDIRARYELGRGVHAWLGLDRVFDRNTPSIGIGIKR